MADHEQPFNRDPSEDEDGRPSKRAKRFGDFDNLFAAPKLDRGSIASSANADAGFSPRNMEGLDDHRQLTIGGPEDLTSMDTGFFARHTGVVNCYLCGNDLVPDFDNFEDTICALCDTELKRLEAGRGAAQFAATTAQGEDDVIDSGHEVDETNGNGGDDSDTRSELDIEIEPEDGVVETADAEVDASVEDDIPEFWADVQHAKHFLTLDDEQETFRTLFAKEDLSVINDAHFVESEVEAMYDLLTTYDPLAAIPNKVTNVAKFHNSQRTELGRLQKLLSTKHRRQRASARCTVVVGKIQRLHRRGVPKTREQDGDEPARYGIDEQLSATARLDAVKEVMACLFIARDIIVADDRCLDELILNPAGYLAKKLVNFEGNRKRDGDIARGRAAA